MYEVQNHAQRVYVADVLWAIASGKRLTEETKPFSQIIEKEKREESMSGAEILDHIVSKLGGGK